MTNKEKRDNCLIMVDTYMSEGEYAKAAEALEQVRFYHMLMTAVELPADLLDYYALIPKYQLLKLQQLKSRLYSEERFDADELRDWAIKLDYIINAIENKE